MARSCEYFIECFLKIELRYLDSQSFEEKNSLLSQKNKNFEDALATLSPDELYKLYTFLEMTDEKAVMLRALDRAAKAGHRMAIRKRAKYVIGSGANEHNGCIECGACNCSKARILAKGDNILCTTRCDDYSCLICPVMNIVAIKAL